jgi:TrmH family RNA methyltransferase
MEIKFATYKKEGEYSYALGASVAIELLKNRPEDCLSVIESPDYKNKEGIIENLCEAHNIPMEKNQKLLNMLSPKENCYVAAAFVKRSHVLDKSKPHVVLDRPSDMGNLGSCMRSCAGFCVLDLAVIGNGADAYNPKTVRASMGAFFHVRVQHFNSIRGYLDIYQDNREIYTFMLKADHSLRDLAVDKNRVCSLIFGNEASGLDYSTYKDIGKSVVIAHSDKIDSLALPSAVSIALFAMFK